MKKKKMLFVIVFLCISAAIFCFAQNEYDPCEPEDMNSINHPVKIKKTPLEIRVKILEKKLASLEKQMNILLADNKSDNQNIEALKSDINILKSKCKVTTKTVYVERSPSRKRQHRMTVPLNNDNR